MTLTNNYHIITNGNDLDGSEGSITSAFSGTSVHNENDNVNVNTVPGGPVIINNSNSDYDNTIFEPIFNIETNVL